MAGLEIHEAAAQGDADTLLEHLRTGKFDVNLKDNDWNDKTALHWASAKGYVECIRILLEHGADGTAKTDYGWTPAHMAAETGKLTVLRAFRDAHVSLNKKDTQGDRPIDVAAVYGHHDCVTFLHHVAEEQRKRREKLGLKEDSDDESNENER